MKILFALLLVFFGSVSMAQEPPETSCERLLDDSTDLIYLSIHAAQQGDWDESFQYDNLVFLSLIRALSYCENEDLEKVRTFLRDHRRVSDEMTCIFHIQAARAHFTRGKLASQYFDNYVTAKRLLGWSIYYADEAIARCGDEKKQALFEFKKETNHILELINEQLAFSSEDTDGHQGR